MYNTLLAHVCEAAEGDKERWDLAQVFTYFIVSFIRHSKKKFSLSSFFA